MQPKDHSFQRAYIIIRLSYLGRCCKLFDLFLKIMKINDFLSVFGHSLSFWGHAVPIGVGTRLYTPTPRLCNVSTLLGIPFRSFVQLPSGRRASLYATPDGGKRLLIQHPPYWIYPMRFFIMRGMMIDKV